MSGGADVKDDRFQHWGCNLEIVGTRPASSTTSDQLAKRAKGETLTVD